MSSIVKALWREFGAKGGRFVCQFSFCIGQWSWVLASLWFWDELDECWRDSLAYDSSFREVPKQKVTSFVPWDTALPDCSFERLDEPSYFAWNCGWEKIKYPVAHAWVQSLFAFALLQWPYLSHKTISTLLFRVSPEWGAQGKNIHLQLIPCTLVHKPNVEAFLFLWWEWNQWC